MAEIVKTDNGHIAAKVALRTHFLDTYHGDGSGTVLDCCQGEGVLWNIIRRTHPVASYWGVDQKKKKGRLAIDSVRLLQQKGITQNIIDIDTYGSPWKHWLALLPNLTQPRTVFLTIGGTMHRGSTCSDVLQVLGCEFRTQDFPVSFWGKLSQIGTTYVLARGCVHATIVEAVEAQVSGSARYIGVRLEPKNDGQQVATADRQHNSVAKELKHV